MLFIEKTKGQLAYLYRLKVNLEKRLRLMPEGNLRRKKTRNKIYYYVKDGSIITRACFSGASQKFWLQWFWILMDWNLNTRQR